MKGALNDSSQMDTETEAAIVLEGLKGNISVVELCGRHQISQTQYSYDLVTLEGKLAVTNVQSKAVTLEITKNLSGEIKSSQPEAAVEKLAKGLKKMNTALKLTWTIDLQPGEHKELGYTYEVYVQR